MASTASRGSHQEIVPQSQSIYAGFPTLAALPPIPHPPPLQQFPTFPGYPSPVRDITGGTWFFVPHRRPQPYYNINLNAPPLAPTHNIDMDINTSPLHSTVSTSATRPRSVMRPTPASQRSEWVMWVGNVPTDATPAEMRAFFGAPDITPENGVLSIFVIAHSRCALINYASDVHLHTAIARFDDVPLRAAPSVDLASPALSRQNQWPLSSSSPAARAARLVCRVGRSDDPGGGGGGRANDAMRVRAAPRSVSDLQGSPTNAAPDYFASRPLTSTSSTDSSRAMSSYTTSSSPVFAPTATSSVSSFELLAEEEEEKFTYVSSAPEAEGAEWGPDVGIQHYFILKSLTRAALAASLATGTWATQNHVAPALTRAFRSDGEVFLVFGVNGEGTWAGCARMTGPIGHPDAVHAHASRSSSSSQPTTPAEPISPAAFAPPFALQWLATAPIPFAHTRHLRNTWNLDREVKVARDGTEVEPVAGRGLVGMWFVGEGLRGSQMEQWTQTQTQTQLPLFMPLTISGAKRTSGKKQKHSPRPVAARAEWWSRQSGSRVSEEAAAAAVMAA